MLLCLLGACVNQPAKQVIYSGNPEPIEVPQEVVLDYQESDTFHKARIIADILYDARLAFDDNRLMSPYGNNAYERYLEVLQLDSANEVALRGLEEVFLRYITLADSALRQGKYDEAATLLNRAESLNSERAELDAARQRLQAASRNKVEAFPLDASGLKAQSLETLNRLAEIAQYIQSNEANFLINARNDEEGRWIYKVMREAVGGYRLRGNIEISGTPNILVTVPKS